MAISQDERKGSAESARRVVRRREVTIRDVARTLNISHPTVSRALHGRPGVGEELIQLIKKKADELGYLPNRSAQDLRGLPSDLIGLVIPDLRNDLWGRVTKELASGLRERGFKLVLADADEDSSLELLEVKSLREARVGGIIIAPTQQIRPQTVQILRDVRTVQLLRSHTKLNAPVVTADMHSGAVQAVEHLRSLGHRRVAYVGVTQDYAIGREGQQGYNDAMKGIDFDPEYCNAGAPIASFGEAATRLLLSKRAQPSAIVYANSELTFGGIKILRSSGLRIPDDISIVGHHDPVWFEQWGPGITTVAMPLKELAHAAVHTLLTSLEESVQANFSTRRQKQIRFCFPPHLVIRGTTAAPTSR